MPRMSAEWFESLVDQIPDGAVPDDGVLAVPAVAVPVAAFGVPLMVDRFSVDLEALLTSSK